MTTNSAVFVVGAGGLLGRAITRARPGCQIAESVPWHDPAARRIALRTQVHDFITRSGDRRKALIWVAGAAGVSAAVEQAAGETRALAEFLADLGECAFDTLFLASSAGAVYAGAGPAPFDEHSPTAAVSDYGRAKLAQEQLVSALAADTAVIIGRISNLYGPRPGYRLGLVNRLCLAAVSRQPVNLFVPLDTIRDYLFADDAAHLVWREVDAAQHPGLFIRVLGSGRPATVASVVATVEQVAHRRVPLALGSDPSAALQPADTRVQPSWMTQDCEFAPLDLGTGVDRILSDLVTERR